MRTRHPGTTFLVLLAAIAIIVTTITAEGQQGQADRRQTGPTPVQKEKLQSMGLHEAGEDKVPYPSTDLDAPPKGFNERNLAHIIHYHGPIGGPINIRGVLYVMQPDTSTFSDGTVSKGPHGGPFEGRYRLTREHPVAYIYDEDTILRRHRLEIEIDYDLKLIHYRECWRVLGVWTCEQWHILVPSW